MPDSIPSGLGIDWKRQKSSRFVDRGAYLQQIGDYSLMDLLFTIRSKALQVRLKSITDEAWRRDVSLPETKTDMEAGSEEEGAHV